MFKLKKLNFTLENLNEKIFFIIKLHKNKNDTINKFKFEIDT